MIEEALKYLHSLKIGPVEVDSVHYWPDGRSVHEKGSATERLARVPHVAEVPTLAGLVAFAATESDALGFAVCHDQVALWEPRDELNNLCALALCRFTAQPIETGRRLGADEFIAQLRSRVERSDARNALEKAVSGTKAGKAVEVQAVEFGTRVKVEAGPENAAWAELPSTFTLSAAKTFSEVAQPPSVYTLHVTISGDSPAFELREADGGAWKHLACEIIAGHLRSLLKAAKLDLPVFA